MIWFMNYESINIIIGLDLSLTSTGIAVYTNVIRSSTQIDELLNSYTNYRIPAFPSVHFWTKAVKTSSKTNYHTRYLTILNEIMTLVQQLGGNPNNILIIIEGYSFGSFSASSSTAGLVELGGIIKFSLTAHGFSYITVPPTVLKKFVTGKGNSKKEDMKVSLYKKISLEFNTSDEADACGLMLFGLRLINAPVPFLGSVSKVETTCLNIIRNKIHS